MIFKILAFIAAAIPIFLFERSIFFRRTTRINEGLREFKKQANLAVSIFLFLIVCVVVFAAGKLAWTWWSSLNRLEVFVGFKFPLDLREECRGDRLHHAENGDGDLGIAEYLLDRSSKGDYGTL
jgi:hypothetical protein